MKDVCEWLRRAEKDLRAAEVLLGEELYEEAAFHAQQAAEKALKALLVAHRVRPPKTHSIEYLLSLLAGHENVKPFYDIDAAERTARSGARRTILYLILEILERSPGREPTEEELGKTSTGG